MEQRPRNTKHTIAEWLPVIWTVVGGLKAGWTVSECKIVCEDRPCVYPYLQISVSE